MGYLSESIAMEARHQRCYLQWQSHYTQCQKSILKAVNLCQKTRQILIFGAGSLLDIPLEQISQRFERVVLIDLFFLRSAKRIAQKYGNVELVEYDISESLEALFLGTTHIASPKFKLDEGDVDCVVSLNLVTQVPLVPVRWLLNQYDIDEMQADQIGKALIQAHLTYLNQFNHVVKCLIADREMLEMDRDGKLLERLDPAWDIALPEYDESWYWEVIPFGESYHDRGLMQKNLVGVSIWQ